jgi:hypothetical protein
MLSQRERCRHDGAGRMDERRHVHVIEIECIGADAVDERCIHHIEPLVASRYGCL